MGRAAQELLACTEFGLGRSKGYSLVHYPRAGFPARRASRGPPESSSEDPGVWGQASPDMPLMSSSKGTQVHPRQP